MQLLLRPDSRTLPRPGSLDVSSSSRPMCLKCFFASSFVQWCVEASLGLLLRGTFWKSTFPERTCSWSQSCFTSKCVTFPTSTARQDAFDRRRITVDLDLHVIYELPAELRNTKNLATHLQRCIQFSLSARQSDTRLSSRVARQQVRSMQNHSSAGGSPGELATSPVTVGVQGQFSWMILPLVEKCRCESLSQES